MVRIFVVNIYTIMNVGTYTHQRNTNQEINISPNQVQQLLNMLSNSGNVTQNKIKQINQNTSLWTSHNTFCTWNFILDCILPYILDSKFYYIFYMKTIYIFIIISSKMTRLK